jgi:RNA polymerase sigma-70 factor (sigma-E family)
MAESDFTQYVEARTGQLLRLAYLLAGEAHAAEDLVQETLLRAHRRWDRVSRAGNPDAYVRRILINQHQSRHRRRASTELVVAPSALAADPMVDSQDNLAARDQAWRLLQELPTQQRAVLVLRYYEDLSDADIADILGCAQGTVRSVAARAFAALRRHPDLAAYAVPAPTPASHPEETS